MRPATRTALLVAAFTATAFTAPTASATETVEVVNEKTGTHCATSGANQCNLHMSGSWTFRVDFGVFGEAHELTCNVEVEARLAESGSGLIDALEKTPGDANCATIATECNLPWPTNGEEEGATGVVQSSMTACIDPSEGPVCQGTTAFDLVEIAGEGYQRQFNNSSVGLCEFDIDLTMESTVTSNATIHVNHP